MVSNRDPGSFRDPSGFVFVLDGVLYRQVNHSFASQYRQLIDSGLYAELVGEGLLVRHEETPIRTADMPAPYAVLKPERIPFISYPYEWCFGQLKAAAELTLEVGRRALAYGMTLRDASAYNVQFIGSRPIFIDTLSFGSYEETPWIAYRQFCTHFLGPLALMSFVHPSLGQSSRLHVDGIPLDVASRALPLSTWLRPGLVTHLHIHGRTNDHGRDGEHGVPTARRMGKTSMLGLLDSLSRTIRHLSWTPPRSRWSAYTETSNYTPAAHRHKQQLVSQWFSQIRDPVPNLVWDLGANTGTYSSIVADERNIVVSLDSDHSSVERLFRAYPAASNKRILPLVQDLTNPSGGIGWRNRERRSLEGRGPADVVLALALVHHLVIAGNIPMFAVVEFFSNVCRHLIIEFVPPEDSQVQRMLALRKDPPVDYSEADFQSAFEKSFERLESASITESTRTLYLLKRR